MILHCIKPQCIVVVEFFGRKQATNLNGLAGRTYNFF